MKPDETVEARPISAGITYDGIRVVMSGLKPGETVVTDGQVRLTAGAKVSVKSPDAMTDTNSAAGEL
jgi:multidrug efflux pump subunit AcrA (membrane-fusion protein)